MAKRKKITKFDSGLNSAVEVTLAKGTLTRTAPPRFIPTVNVSKIVFFWDGSAGVK